MILKYSAGDVCMNPLLVQLLISIGMIMFGGIVLFSLYIDFTDARKSKKLTLWLFIRVIFEVINVVYLGAFMFFLIGLLILILTISEFISTL
jgi:hypothetical protein